MKSIKVISLLSFLSFFFFILSFSIFFLFSPNRVEAMSIGVPSNILNLSSGLVGWWTFDGKDVVNGVIRDKSGQGNHGNAINIASSTFYTKGKVGQAGNFDGGDDYVSVSNNSSFKPTGAMTISGWF